MYENHLRATQDTPERLQKNLGRKYNILTCNKILVTKIFLNDSQNI